MKKLLMIFFPAMLLACALSTPASAAVLFWGLDADNDWANVNNWTPDGVAIGPLPGPADHAIIFQSAISPTVTTVEQVSIFAPSWFDGHNSTVNIGPGGSVGASAFARLSAGNSSSSTVNFLPGAGVSVWSVLQMSFNNAAGGFPLAGTEADSFINLDGGILHLGAISFVNNGSNTTNIDIGVGGTLLVNGDQTDAGTGGATAVINAGWLTAVDGAGIVNVSYDADNGRTVFTATAIPEPTTLALLGLGLMATLSSRRR